MAYAKREDVEQFLSDFHRTAKSGLYVVDRNKNFEFLLSHGMSAQDRLDAIGSLCVEDYFGGPEPDRDHSEPPACIWKFCVCRDGVDIYIKLKLVRSVNPMKAKCISFHEPEQPVSHFPHKR